MTDQEKDYQHYKEYQKRHQISLDLVSDPENLKQLSTDELSKHYSIAGKIYNLRLNFRNRYIAPDKWCVNHQLYLEYLRNVINSYSTILNSRIALEQSKVSVKTDISDNKTEITPKETVLNECEHIESQSKETQELPTPFKSEPTPSTSKPTPSTSTPAPPTSTPTPSKSKPVSKSKAKKLEQRKFEQQWNKQIRETQKLEKDNADQVERIIILTRKALKSVKPDVTIADTIDILHYFYECIGIAKQHRQKVLHTKTILSFDSADYSRDIKEYSRQYNRLRPGFLDVYRRVLRYDEDDLLMLVETVLEATRFGTKHFMHYFEVDEIGAVAIFPTIPMNFSEITTENKACVVLHWWKMYSPKIYVFDDNYLVNIESPKLRRLAMSGRTKKH